MKKTVGFLFGLLIATLINARGATVGFSTLGSRSIADQSATLLGSSNSLVWVGNFTSESFTFNPLVSIATNVQIITSAGGWRQFGLDTVSGSPDPGVTLPGITINSSGKLTGTLADDNGGATQAQYFVGRNLYLWIFNATTVSAATQMGIFRSPDAVQPWVFGAIGLSGNITYSDGSGGAPTVNPIGSAGTTSTTQLGLVAAVPEPSVLALVGMATLGMLASRKRGMSK